MVARPLATVTPTPVHTPLPTASPVVHQVVTHVVTHPAHFDLVTTVSKAVSSVPQPELVLFGGVVLVVVQSFVNKFPWLKGDADELSQKYQDVKREALALGLPGLLTALFSLLNGTNLMGYWLELYASAKIIFNALKLAFTLNNSAQQAKVAPAINSDGGVGEQPANG